MRSGRAGADGLSAEKFRMGGTLNRDRPPPSGIAPVCAAAAACAYRPPILTLTLYRPSVCNLQSLMAACQWLCSVVTAAKRTPPNTKERVDLISIELFGLIPKSCSNWGWHRMKSQTEHLPGSAIFVCGGIGTMEHRSLGHHRESTRDSGLITADDVALGGLEAELAARLSS